MLKRLISFTVIIAMMLMTSSCGAVKQNQKEMSEAEIQQVLSSVVGGEQALKEAGLKYFSELSNENRNIIDSKKLQESLDTNPESVFVLDIRNKEDFDKGHIQGATNIWWFDVGKNIDTLPKDKPIVVCCYTGQSAAQVVGVLKVMGYNATALLGGMNNGWIAEKMPLTTE